MSPASRFGNRVIRGSLWFAFWTLIGLSFASQLYLSSAKTGVPVSWGQAVGWSLGDWYVWALLAVPIVQLAQRFRFDASGWVRHLGVHLVASLFFSLLYVVLRALVGQLQSRLAGAPISFAQAFDPLVVKTFNINLIYWVIVSVSHAFSYYRQYQERALRATELEKRLTEARLQALQMQLNPHFLFNTLNAISSLMHKDVRSADRMLARLADLLRYALDSTDAQEVPLSKELSFLERYLEIEQTRFGPRLTVNQEVAGDALDLLVPNLVLQPLVENAIKHGIEKRSRPGIIHLRAAVQDGSLRLEVQDNGPGLATPSSPTGGIGVANTRARLRQLYGEAHRFEMRNLAEGGVLVTLDLPLRRPPAKSGRNGAPESGKRKEL